jgi:hypothetical protein
MKFFRFLLFLFLTSIIHNTYGGDFVWFNKKDLFFYKIDLETGNLSKRKKNSDWKFDKKVSLDSVNEGGLIQDFTLNPIYHHNSIYFFSAGTNRTFEYNFVENYFKEFESFDQKGVDFESFVFETNEGVFKLGGAGFWNVNNQFYQFNFSRNKWEYLPCYGESPMAVISNFSQYDPIENKIIILDVYETTIHKNLEKFAFYALDLKNRNWEKIGYLTHPRLVEYFNKFQGMNTRLGDYNLLPIDNDYFVLDFKRNKLYQYFGSERHFFHDKKFFEYNFEGEKYYIFGNHGIMDYSQGYIVKFSQDKFFEKNSLIGDLYEPVSMILPINSFHVYLSFSLILIFLLIIYFLNKKETKGLIRVDKNSYETILNKLLDLGVQEYNMEDINYVLGLEGKSSDTQRHYRSKFFTEFNKYFLENYKIESAIKRVQAKNDKRFMVYVLDEELVKMPKG